MRLALVIMTNSHEWIRLHVPHLLDAVDGCILVDSSTGDEVQALARQWGASYYHHPFENHYGKQAQRLIDYAEREGYDALLRLDSDETMFTHDVDKIRAALRANPYHLLQLPRINFVGDRLHYSPDIDPYDQFRAWTLGKGIRYHDVPVHETPTVPQGIRVHPINAPIYHYGAIAPRMVIEQRAKRYARLGHVQDTLKHSTYTTLPYTGTQPIDPEAIGIRAPYERLYRMLSAIEAL